MNHADDILAELIALLDVCNAGLGDIGKSLLAANAQVPPIMIVGSVPTNGVAFTMHTVRKFLGTLTPHYIAGFLMTENGFDSGKRMLSMVLRSVFNSSVLIGFRNPNDLSIFSLTLQVVFSCSREVKHD